MKEFDKIISKNLLLIGLARFAFMHCIGSSLCFWANTIIEETLDSLVDKLTKKTMYCENTDAPKEYSFYGNESASEQTFVSCYYFTTKTVKQF